MAKSDKAAREKLAQNKKLRRRWLTWVRMARYGANNFTRNAWLTIAAMAVMTITLLLIFTTFVARQALSGTVDEIRQKVDISINLRADIKKSEVDGLVSKLYATSDVNSVRYISLRDAKDAYIDAQKPSVEQLQVISELPEELNPFFPTLRVVVKDPNNTKSLETLVAEDDDFKSALHPDPKRAPSFVGKRQNQIETISRWASLAEKGGLVISGLFVAISMLIIFNTIRMAIFNRKDEIEMMKLIGADKSFIRGPFVVEAVMYGFIAALIATALGYTLFFAVVPQLAKWGIAIDSTQELLSTFSPLVLLCMIILGAAIGSISSRLAVRRYLKV